MLMQSPANSDINETMNQIFGEAHRVQLAASAHIRAQRDRDELLAACLSARKYLCDENRKADDLLPVIDELKLAIANAEKI